MRRFVALLLIGVLLTSAGANVRASLQDASPVWRRLDSLSGLYLTHVLTNDRRLGRVKLRAPVRELTANRAVKSSSTKPLPKAVIPLLAYHHLAPSELNMHLLAGEVTTPEQFEKDLTYLREKGYTTVFFGDLLNAIDGKADLPSKPAIIFFDDGYQSNYVYAWPLLKKYGMKATINLVTSWVPEKAAPFGPATTTYLAWEQVKEMANSGVVDFQSHTHDLHRQDHGTPLIEKVDEDRLQQDFATSKRLIEEHTGRAVTVLSYPFAAHTALSDRIGQRFFRIALNLKGIDAFGQPLGVSTRRLNVQFQRNAAVRLADIGQ
ncbi:MAG: polysaccharide deacetylase family protein [Bacillota bacterium]